MTSDGRPSEEDLLSAFPNMSAARERFFARLAAGPAIMGIVNVTPDSFSDGGLFVTPQSALAQAQKLVADGADIIDIGAESTRPGHIPVSAAEEWARLEPMLRLIVEKAGAPVSIDTYKAETAGRALRAGVAVVNDVWGLQRDPNMGPVIAESGAGVVIMHNREQVDPDIDILSDVLNFFERSVSIAERSGVPKERILLDPGVGFGKTRAQNYEVLRQTGALVALGFPVLIGVSRKSIFRDLPSGGVDGRLVGTLVANIYAASLGARAFRVHDAIEHKAAFAALAALKGREVRSGS